MGAHTAVLEHTATRVGESQPVWTMIPGVFELIMVAHIDGMPRALIEKRSEKLFQLTTSNGDYLGTFTSTVAAKHAFDGYLATESKAA